MILHLNPRHAFWLEVAALVGFALSALIWLGVAVTTPAPMAVVDAAKLGARRVHDRLPAEIRERLPEEFRLKITGSYDVWVGHSCPTPSTFGLLVLLSGTVSASEKRRTGVSDPT